jgi:hypothetical protein
LKAVLPEYLKSMHSVLGNEILEKLPSNKMSFIYDCLSDEPKEKAKKPLLKKKTVIT